MGYNLQRVRHEQRTYGLDGVQISSIRPDITNNTIVYASDLIDVTLRDNSLGGGLLVGRKMGFEFERVTPASAALDSFYIWDITNKFGIPTTYEFTKSFSNLQTVIRQNPNPEIEANSIFFFGARDFAESFQEDPLALEFGNFNLRLFHAQSVSPINSLNFDLRGIKIKDFEVECPFVDILSKDNKMKVTGKISVFPNITDSNLAGWTPTEDIQYQVVIKHESLPNGEFRLPVRTLDKNSDIMAPNNDGVVATFEEEWDGQLASGEFCLDNVEVTCRAIMPTPNGNTITPEASTSVTFNFCSNNEKNGIFRLAEIFSFFDSPLGAVQAGFNYLSSKLKDQPASMGHGWFSTQNVKIFNVNGDDTDLVYCDESGNCHRWLKNGADYEPLLTNHRLDIEVDPLGGDEYYKVVSRGQEERTFNSLGVLRKHIDSNDNVTLFDDTVSGDRYTITGPNGRQIHYHFDETSPGSGIYEPQPSEISTSSTKGDTSPGVRSYKFTYTSGAEQRVQTIEDPVGDVTRFSYDADGRLLTRREERPDQGDRLITYTYKDEGRLDQVVFSSFTTDVVPVETQHNRTTYSYEQAFSFPVNGVDTDFIVTEMLAEDLEDTSTKSRLTKMASDVLGRATAEFELVEDDAMDPNSYRAAVYSYNDPTDVNNPSDSDDIYLVSEVSNYNGIERRSTTTYEYTERGNLRRVLDDQGNETLVTYAEEVNPNPLPNFPDYPVEVRRPSPDDMASPVVYYEPTKYTYDSATGDLLSIRDANLDGGSQGQLTTITYNGQGQVETVTNRNGFLRIFEYSGSTANLVNVYVEKSSTPSSNPVDPNTRPSEFRKYTIGYDSFDNVTSVVDNNGVSVGFDYDEMDRLIKTTTKPETTDIETMFHYEDRILKSVDLPSVNFGANASGVREASLVYDHLGRLEEVTRDISSSVLDQSRVAFSYDGFGQTKVLTRTKDINGTPTPKSFEMEYDRIGRPKSSTDPLSKTTTMAYEKACKGRAVTTARGVRRRTNFDSLCRLTRIEAGAPSAGDDMSVEMASECRDFIYDDLGRLIKSSQGMGAGGAAGYGTAIYGQDFYGGQAMAAAEEREYQYDSLDRLTPLSARIA